MQDSLFNSCAANTEASDSLGGIDSVENIPLQMQQRTVAQLHFYARAYAEQADAWFDQLLTQTPWQQDSLNIAGKTIAIPRLQCWYGEADAAYGYSGLTLKPLPWTQLLHQIKQEVETLTGHSFNSALVNLYRDGQDSVSWHADDEPELGEDPIIASLSRGQSRECSLMAKKTFRQNTSKATKATKLTLNHGSLLLMGAGVQRFFVHSVAKQKALHKPRINITFRKIYK